MSNAGLPPPLKVATGPLEGLQFWKPSDPKLYNPLAVSLRAVPTGSLVSVLPANPQEFEWDDATKNDELNARANRPCNEEIMEDEIRKYVGLMRPLR